jgi:hypothetical protein
VVLGVAAGRLTYIGIRGAYHFGNPRRAGTSGSTGITEVRTRAVLAAVDLGVLLPVGAIEIVPGISVGAIRFSQRARYEPPMLPQADVRSHAIRALVSPGLSVHVRVARILLIPELQMHLAGDPKPASAVQYRAAAVSLRAVLTREVGRIRH